MAGIVGRFSRFPRGIQIKYPYGTNTEQYFESLWNVTQHGFRDINYKTALNLKETTEKIANLCLRGTHLLRHLNK